MSHEIRFRILLPVAQTVLAALFGGVGLWQRNQILSQRFLGDQTFWESTARFHVWPWPYKFAAISNLPALLAGALVSLPINTLWPELPEAVELAPSLVLVAMLWYWVGRRLDRRSPGIGAARMLAGTETPWILLFVFTAVCLIGAFLPIGYVGYLPYGAAVWVATVATIRRTTKRPAAQTTASLASTAVRTSNRR